MNHEYNHGRPFSKRFHFQFINYTPRGGTKPTAADLMNQIENYLPENSSGKGVVKYDGKGFNFSIVVRSGNEVFSVDNYVSKAESSKRERHWQIPELNRLATEIAHQIEGWQLAKRRGFDFR